MFNFCRGYGNGDVIVCAPVSNSCPIPFHWSVLAMNECLLHRFTFTLINSAEQLWSCGKFCSCPIWKSYGCRSPDFTAFTLKSMYTHKYLFKTRRTYVLHTLSLYIPINVKVSAHALATLAPPINSYANDYKYTSVTF